MCCHICSCSTVSKGPEDRPMKCPKCRHRVSEVFLKHFLTEVPVVLVRRNVGSASSACVCPAPSAPQVPPASQPAPAPPLLSALFLIPRHPRRCYQDCRHLPAHADQGRGPAQPAARRPGSAMSWAPESCTRPSTAPSPTGPCAGCSRCGHTAPRGAASIPGCARLW